jgi:hypothetical protein
MKYTTTELLLFAVTIFFSATSFAHHNTNTEFGWFEEPTLTFQGKIVRVSWGNPHVAIDVESLGGEIPAGEKLRLLSHPINVMDTHGLPGDDYVVGQTLRVTGWRHRGGQPLIWLRALQVEDGPNKSFMRYSDMQDIANGVLEEKQIVPAANVNGSSPARAGTEAVAKLKAMGLIDADGLMIWPANQETTGLE